MAQPPVIGHFWDPAEAAYDAIVTLKDAGTEYRDEDVTWMAWEAICRIYFPRRATTAGGVKYLIRREPYRALAPDNRRSHRPDMVIVELSTPQVGPDGLLRSVKRDILWVECKAPGRNQPGSWKLVISEATRRLEASHPDRNVWLLVASGLKWMVFYWDPNNVQNPRLQVQSARFDGQLLWDIDPRIHVPPIPGQRHIDQNGIVHTDRAYSLDFWTQAPAIPGQPPQPLNQTSCLMFLESIIQAVQTGNYVQANPAGMS